MRRVGIAAGLVVIVGSAAIGANVLGIRDRLFGSATPPAAPPAVSRVIGASPPAASDSDPTVLRSQPWWQVVQTFEGSGDEATDEFTIDSGALQWRVNWSCDTGRLLVRMPTAPEPLVDAACPGPAAGYAVEPGTHRLEVSSDGPWSIEVEQQVDVPLNEPPLPAMSAPGAREILSGRFYRIDQFGRGTVTIYRLPDRSYALRLDDFYVTPNVDLEIRLSPLEAPRTTEQFMKARSAQVSFLDVTTGSLNFKVPRGIDPTKYRSVVIWCELILSAYSAATLEPAD